jgi:hypothetical protein
MEWRGPGRPLLANFLLALALTFLLMGGANLTNETLPGAPLINTTNETLGESLQVPPSNFTNASGEFPDATPANTTNETSGEPPEPETMELSEDDMPELEAAAVYPEEGGFSAEAWIKTDDIADGVVATTGEYGDLESYWSMGKAFAGDSACLYIRLNNGTGEISGVGATDIADGKWHHIVFVRDVESGKALGYVDGALDLEFNDTTGSISDASTSLYIGNANPYQEEWFVGEVSGIETYPHALSEEEVQQLFEQSAGTYRVEN